MTPADFRGFVEAIADQVGFRRDRPDPRRRSPRARTRGSTCPPTEAMAQRRRDGRRVRARRVSPRSTSTPAWAAPASASRSPDELTAERAAGLAAVAEAAVDRDAFQPPVYVIGTEVPVPGGALEELDHLQVTSPEAALQTVEVHRARLRRPRAPGGVRPRHRRGGPARRRVRQRGRRGLRPGEGPGAERRARPRSRSSCSRPTRPTTSRPRPWRRWSRTASPILKVGPGPDLRAARGALRARPHRGGSRRRAPGASAGDGSPDAREAGSTGESTITATTTRRGFSGTSATPTASATTGPIRRPRPPCSVCATASPIAQYPKRWSASTSPRSIRPWRRGMSRPSHPPC